MLPGFAFDEQGQVKRATAEYYEAIRLGPKFAVGYYNRDNSYSNLSKPGGAHSPTIERLSGEELGSKHPYILAIECAPALLETKTFLSPIIEFSPWLCAALRTGPNRRALNPSPTVGTRLFFSRYGAPRPKLSIGAISFRPDIVVIDAGLKRKGDLVQEDCNTY